MKLEKLYKKDLRGNTLFLELYTRKNTGSNTYTQYSRTGIVGKENKAKIAKVVFDKGKNIGRKNETSVKEQIEKETISLFNKKTYEGYKTDLNYVNSTIYNTFPDKSLMPMLLEKYKPNTSKKFKEGYLQRKYDGVRCIAERYNGEIRLKSREGKIFNLPHILKNVEKIMNLQLDQTLDGELYIHGVELHDIVSMVKTDDPNLKLEYHIYDVAIEKLTFEQRRNLLLALDTSEFSNIYVDAGVPVESEEKVKAYHKESLDLKYEGTIYCSPDSLYNASFRTKGKQKIKPRVTEEFECIDQYWNKGKMSNQTTLICRTKDGNTFHVKLKGTADQREEWAANFDEKVKNKMITVEFRKKAKKSGVPIEAVGVAIRDYE